MGDSAPELSVVVRIDNHDQVAAAYGSAATKDMTAAIQRRLAALGGVLCTVAARDPRHVRVDFRDLSSVYAGQAAPLSAEAAVELLLFSIASIHLAFGDETILIAPSIASVASRSEANAAEHFVGAVPRAMGPPSAEWCRQYREDMRCAAAIFAAIEDDRVQLAWQPVRHAVNADDILYHECLVRAADTSRRALMPGEFIPALERLGLVRAFDCHMVRSVIDELRGTPETLAVNISALSAADDGWWHSLVKTLRGMPNLASRLVIEITETAEIVSIGRTVGFVTEMRKLGCAIAIDDFGMGHNSLRCVIALRPDVVKIDAFYIGWAEQAPDGQESIAHLVGLLRTLAPVVVAEGVSTQGQSDLICDAGAVWQQGYYHGSPTVIRPSLYGASASGTFTATEARWPQMAGRI